LVAQRNDYDPITGMENAIVYDGIKGRAEPSFFLISITVPSAGPSV